MNIVMICNEYPPAPHGGIGTFVQTTARAFAQRGHHVEVLGLGEADGEIHRDGDVIVHTIREKFWPGRFQVVTNRLRLLRALKRIVRQSRADIVELPDYLGMLPFRFTDCATVVRLHLSKTAIAMHAGAPVDPMVRWAERRTLAKNRNWIGVSKHAIGLAERAFGLTSANTAVIYSGLDISASQEPPSLPARFVLFGGTVSSRKGALVLASAARTFLTRHADVALVYAGRTEDHTDAAIREIIGLEFANRVHFLGPLPRAQFLECIRRCELFVFPSTLETFGLVVAEAMLCGTAVVTSNAPPFTEFVENNQTGLLVPSNDSDAIASAVDRLLSDAELRGRLGLAGQAFIRENYSVEQAVAGTLAFYRQVLDAQKR
jgi:glycosyltransferase involved in cell wall biosynthesis